MDFGFGNTRIQRRGEGEGEGEGVGGTETERDSGYICFGNWQKLCSGKVGGSKDTSGRNNTAWKRARKSGHAEKREKRARIVQRMVASANGTTTSTSTQSTESPTMTTSMLPTLDTSFPLPVPSQTDCNFDYI